VYPEVEPALDLLGQFITDRTTRVVRIGLHKSLLESFNSQLTKDVNNGLGLAELVNERRSPAEGGRALGFERLGFEATKFHSWLRHRAADEMYKRFGVRPNPRRRHVVLFTTIDTYARARHRCFALAPVASVNTHLSLLW